MFALTLCGVTVLVTDLGASTDLSRRVAAAPAGARRRLEAVLSARLPLLAAYLVLLPAWVAVTKPDALAVAAAIAVFSVCKDVYRTYSSLFLGLHRIEYTVAAFGTSLLVLVAAVAAGAADRRRVGVDDRGPRAQRRGAPGCGGRHHATQDRAHPAPMRVAPDEACLQGVRLVIRSLGRGSGALRRRYGDAGLPAAVRAGRPVPGGGQAARGIPIRGPAPDADPAPGVRGARVPAAVGATCAA